MQPPSIIDEMTLERGGRVPVNQARGYALDSFFRKKNCIISWFILRSRTDIARKNW